MIQNNLIPVEGKPNLYRDSRSNAIVCADNTAYNQHMKYIKEKEYEKIKIQSLESEISSIKSDVAEIKHLLLNMMK